MGHQNPGSPAGHHFEVKERELPRATKLLEESFKDLQDNFGGYFVVGLPIFCVAMVVSVLSVGFFFLGMIPLMATGNDESIFMFFGIWFVALLGTSVLVTLPMQASQGRAVWRHLTNGEPMTFTGAFKDVSRDLPSLFAAQILITVLSLVGLLFFFFPMLIVAMFCSFTIPAILVHRLGAFEALSLSFSHARRNPWWHFKVWMVGILVTAAASQVPLLGAIMAGPWLFSYTFRAYRAAFGDGETLPINS